MAFLKATGSCAGVDLLVTAIRNFMVTSLGWVEEATGIESGGAWYVLSSTGESAAESIYVGLYASKKPFVDDLANVQFQLYTGCGAGCGFCNQPGALCCGNPIHATQKGWERLPMIPVSTITDTNYYWLYGDKDAVVVITKSGALYHAGYLGLISRFLTSGNDPYPVYGIGSGHWCPNYCCYCIPTMSWPYALTAWQAQKWVRNRANTEWVCSCYICKCLLGGGLNIAYGILVNQGQQPSFFGGGYSLNPIYVATVGDGARGTLKHVYNVGRAGLSAEGTISVGGNNYKAFPNLLGSDSDRWLAIRDYT